MQTLKDVESDRPASGQGATSGLPFWASAARPYRVWPRFARRLTESTVKECLFCCFGGGFARHPFSEADLSVFNSKTLTVHDAAYQEVIKQALARVSG